MALSVLHSVPVWTCVFACNYMRTLNERQMVKSWWRTYYWLQVKERPGKGVISMPVSMSHSIMALNHRLPMLDCKQHLDRTVASAYHI